MHVQVKISSTTRFYWTRCKKIMNHEICSIFLTSITSSMNSKRNIFHTIIIMKVYIKQRLRRTPNFIIVLSTFIFRSMMRQFDVKSILSIEEDAHIYITLKFFLSFLYQMKKEFRLLPFVADIVSHGE